MPELAQFRKHIEAALAYSGGTHTFEDIEVQVASGQLQFWPGVDSVVITEILTYPRTKILHFFLAGGNLAEIEAMSEPLLQWGREQGCTIATLTGRRGWEKTFLSRTGWAPTLVSFTKNLYGQ